MSKRKEWFAGNHDNMYVRVERSTRLPADCCISELALCRAIVHGRIQDFKSGRTLNIIAPSGTRRENSEGISCEKSRFY